MREKRRTIGVLPFFPLAAILLHILVHHMLNAGDRARCGEASAPCLRGCAGQPVFVAENRAWLLKDDAGMYALSAVCSHLGCTVRWEAGAFRCPCHGSEYDAAGGVLQGPATRPLPTVWVGTDAAGRLVVDRAKPVEAAYRLVV